MSVSEKFNEEESEVSQNSMVEEAVENFEAKAEQEEVTDIGLELQYGSVDNSLKVRNYDEFEDIADYFIKQNGKNVGDLEDVKNDFDKFLGEFLQAPKSPVNDDIYRDADEVMKGFNVRPYSKEMFNGEFLGTEFEFIYEEDGETKKENLVAIMEEDGDAGIIDDGKLYDIHNEDNELVEGKPKGDNQVEISKGYNVDAEDPERYATWVETADRFLKDFNRMMVRNSNISPYDSQAKKQSDLGFIAKTIDSEYEDPKQAINEAVNKSEPIVIGQNQHSGNGSGYRGAHYAQAIQDKVKKLNQADELDCNVELNYGNQETEVYFQ